MELRVHGVSGTPPVDMLGRPLVKQVAGDTDGRFFRPVDAAGAEVRAADGHVLEGYHWGPQTSGSWRQALWLALVPFGLVNAAYFMLPGGGGNGARVVARGALRVLAIVLTGLVVLAIAQAAVDLFAWQWTGVGGRAGDPRWWLAGGFAASVAALLVIRFLVGAPRKLPPNGEPPEDATMTGLARGEFYTGDRDMPALRHLHLTMGLTVLSVLAAALTRQYGGTGVLYWPALGLLVWTVVHAALLGDPLRKRRAVAEFLAVRLPVVVLGAGIALLLGSLVAMALVSGYPVNQRGILPGVGTLGRGAAALALAALVVLVLAAAVLAARTREPERAAGVWTDEHGDPCDEGARDLRAQEGRHRTEAREAPSGARQSDTGVPKPFRRFLGGMVGPVVAALGMFLGVGFTAALAYGVLRALRPADDPASMGLPLFYLRIAFAAGAAVALAVAVALVLVAMMVLSAKRFRLLVRASATPELLPDEQVRGVARAWWLARLKFSMHWIAIVFAVAGTALMVAAMAEAATDLGATVCRPGGTWLSDCRDLPGLDLVTVGTVALLALGGFLVYLGRRAVGDSAVRRAACVVWDVIAFWPAAVHPLVPPPYSPKVIEDLRHRIEWHVSRPGTFLVLAGHSQGSLIAAAALTRLDPLLRNKVALLTYGSQLQLAYCRAFPAYVSYRFLCWLKKNVLADRWVSLYRETDPFGGPVLSWGRVDEPELASHRLGSESPFTDETDPATGVRRCGDEWCLLDPCPSDGDHTPREPMRKHTGFSEEPVWALALAELTAPYRRATDGAVPRRPAAVTHPDR